MKRIVGSFIISILVGIMLTIFLSVLEITKVFLVFRNLNDNMFVVGVLYFLFSLLSLSNSTETGKGISIFSNTIKYDHRDESIDKSKYEKFFLLFITGIVFILVGLTMPIIKLI